MNSYTLMSKSVNDAVKLLLLLQVSIDDFCVMRFNNTTDVELTFTTHFNLDTVKANIEVIGGSHIIAETLKEI